MIEQVRAENKRMIPQREIRIPYIVGSHNNGGVF